MCAIFLDKCCVVHIPFVRMIKSLLLLLLLFSNVHIVVLRRLFFGGARGVMVIVAGIGHVDTSSNPGLIAFHIALIPLGKV